jgi:hypothetical protein
MSIFIQVLIWSALFAIVSPLFWEGSASLGIVTVSALLMHGLTRAKLSKPLFSLSSIALVRAVFMHLLTGAKLPAVLLPSMKLRYFLGVPPVMLAVAVFVVDPFKLDKATNQIILLTMLVVEVCGSIVILWRHRQEIFLAWLVVLLASMWSTSMYLLLTGRIFF